MAQIDKDLLNSLTNLCNAALKSGGLACLDDTNRVINFCNIVIKETQEAQKEPEPIKKEEVN